MHPGSKLRTSAALQDIDPTGELRREREKREQRRKRFEDSFKEAMLAIENDTTVIVDDDDPAQRAPKYEEMQPQEGAKDFDDDELDEFFEGEDDAEQKYRLKQKQEEERKIQNMKGLILKEAQAFIYHTMFRVQHRVQNKSSCKKLASDLSENLFDLYVENNRKRGKDPYRFILTKVIGKNIDSYIELWFDGKIGERKGEGKLDCFPPGMSCILSSDAHESDDKEDELLDQDEPAEDFFF
ncbi:hypothetical protein ADUPG1_009110 [Aduncisulcus paluster]|uniref:Uncharacterized protein n=1 Tax=Aduncisulcus paluster TaxID=2918883 RepID=A0ABQ5KUD6_9EUKA|nr:hypothetical protein ADUPG1_009110 [Aduncisulcus paluster]